jgi:hypothetical protein
MNYDQNDSQQFSFITPLFTTLANTLKIKVGNDVGCIFDVVQCWWIFGFEINYRKTEENHKQNN